MLLSYFPGTTCIMKSVLCHRLNRGTDPHNDLTVITPRYHLHYRYIIYEFHSWIYLSLPVR